MKTRRILPTTLRLVLSLPGKEDKPTLMIMNVANILDENDVIIDFHTMSVDFYWNPLPIEEKRKIESLARKVMDSSNPESWARYGNKTVQQVINEGKYELQ